ncbi:stage II sporulation protein M [Oceanibium sediminis]|uniref:stage II sporulation protein M n=1 Tax=Oceanibium sediminis TaxID=2026339 RepID=UPI000DD45E97|nr:stage II sporulation protein M [Oceanibium sediminis]
MSNVAAALIRSVRFRAEREADWRALEHIVTKAEKRGLQSLTFQEAQSLATLYRQAMASLSTAREISLDNALLQYLEALCARAYLAVYAPQQQLGGLMSRLFLTGMPGAARRLLPLILIAYLILALGAAVGYLLFQDDPTWYNTIVPGGLAGDRGLNATREQLMSAIYSGGDAGSGDLAAFASVLFSHNTRIAIFIFSLGVLICVPSAVLTFYNGMILGAFVALHADRGLLTDILAWLSIHGITELSAVVIACAGGLHLGQAILFPGDMRRRDALRYNARDAVKLAILAGVMLTAAAGLEAFGRQWIQDPAIRASVGIAIGLAWLTWLAFAGRKEGRAR